MKMRHSDLGENMSKEKPTIRLSTIAELNSDMLPKSLVKRRKRIDKMTDSERAMMSEWAAKWINIGLSTERADRATFEAAVRACYRHSGLPEPKRIIWCPSPIVVALAAPIASKILANLAAQGSRDAVNSAVDGAVDDAVGDAVGDAVVRKAIAQVIASGWYRRFGGQHRNWWTAWKLWFRDHGDLELDGDLWDRAQAYADSNVAGYWWAWGDFAMVADRPTTLHLEQVGATGWGSHRLHCEAGPAVAWSDGTAIHAWHGVRVPASLIEGAGWTVEQIHAEPNSEIRRCAIERIGWGRYAELAGLELVSEERDPGHPDADAVLRLYDMPDARRMIGGDVRVLVMVNGSPDRSGDVRVYGETVPATIPSAVEAAAWQYDVPADVYRQLHRRT